MVHPPAKLRAAGSGRKPNSSITAFTKACFSSLTCAVPLRMRETVLGDTPACLATMVRVARDFTTIGLEVVLVVIARLEFIFMRF
jgi:hypothetical protein